MLALLIAAAATAQPLPPEPKSFGDWEVGCDNRRDCEAVGFADPYDPDGTPFIGVIIDRKADAAAEPSAEIDIRFFELEDYSGTVVVDGKLSELRFSKQGELIGSPIELARLLAASKSVSLVDAKGKALGVFRTSGASAALRWMDERQLRVGTVTAVVARGDKPASAIPAPSSLPTIIVPPNSSAPPHKLKPAELKAVRKRFDMCDDPRADIEYYRLDAANSIAIVNCWNGPYQTDGIIVLVPDRGGYRLAPIDPATKEEAKGPALDRSRLISPGYDTERRLLYMEYRGRGLNDCGANASWAWDGTAFRLASYAALDECRGVTARLPHWQTANDPKSE
jgi:hypothetical protein